MSTAQPGAAAARETEEEAGLSVSAEEFVQIAHWTPPPGPQKRFATWFFAAHISGDQAIAIDDGEIKEHSWIRPEDALAKHAAGEIDLVPPTWITLYPSVSIQPGYRSVEPFSAKQLQDLSHPRGQSGER